MANTHLLTAQTKQKSLPFRKFRFRGKKISGEWAQSRKGRQKEQLTRAEEQKRR